MSSVETVKNDSTAPSSNSDSIQSKNATEIESTSQTKKSAKELDPSAQEFHPEKAGNTSNNTSATTNGTNNASNSDTAVTEDSDHNSPNDRRPRDGTQRRNSGNSSNRGTHPWKRNNRKRPTKDEERNGEVLADPNAWPSLEQVKTPDSQQSSKDKKSPRDSKNPESESLTSSDSNSNVNSNANSENGSKKKGTSWVPLPVELQTRSNNNGAPRRGRGGNRSQSSHGNYNSNNNNNGNSNINNTGSSINGNNTNRPNWRKQGNVPNRGGMSSNRGRGRGGMPYMAPMYIMQQVDPDQLRGLLLYQLEYYFSVENLCKDIWLRGQMDDEGWIPLSLLAGFNRVKQLTTDSNLIVEVLKTSTVIELNEEKVRRKEDWKPWLIPKTTTNSGPK